MSRPMVGSGNVGTPQHAVEPNPGGWFDVTSGRSGNVYRVHLDGSCTCVGYEYSEPHACSHVSTVLQFAAALTHPVSA